MTKIRHSFEGCGTMGGFGPNGELIVTSSQILYGADGAQTTSPPIDASGASLPLEVDDSQALAALVGSGLVGSVTAPSSPYSGQIWRSQSVSTLQISSAYADRKNLLTGAAGGFENGFAQEPSVFWNPTAGNWGMVYGGSIGLGYATASSPDGPWTKRGKILGGGTGGFASVTTHARAMVFGGLIYIVFPDFANNTFRITDGAAMPTGTNVPTFTSSSVIFSPNVGGLGITSTLLGNSRIVLAGSTYYLFWEAFKTGVGWQIGTATSSTLSGTYTVGTYPLTTLRPSGVLTANACGGPLAFYENGTYVLYYHAGGGPSTKIYRATSTTATDDWVIDNNGQPWLDRQLPNEISQVADINIVQGPYGAYYAFWDAINNNAGAPVGAINYAPIFTPVYVYDGTASRWTQIGGLPKTTPPEFDFLTAGTLRTASATLANHELGVFDPNTAAANLTATLPYADVGSRVMVVNASYTGSYTVTAAAQSGDSITTGAMTLSPGQFVEYRCFLVNNWTRVGALPTSGTNTIPSGSALNIGGLLQKLSGGYITIYASDQNTSDLDRRPGGSGSTAYLAPQTGTIPVLKQSSTAPDIADSATITTAAVGFSRYTPAASRTGLIMAAGTYDGQIVWVVNKHASNTMTMAAAGTSNVFTGTSCVIAAGQARCFVWDTSDSRWHTS
jgi:hypothetical protein